ncbi:DUF4339 domain-containing protein [Gimesia sp.]|uniref:DUF4339 domain-containing protein n=1 Tax=Gimesia sp. TaxID=2024833 RepID=UPI0032EFD369
MARQWYYEINGKRRGPVDSKTLKQLATSGRLKPTDLVWTDGKDEWKPARIVVGLFPESVVPPPPPVQKKSSVPPPPPPLKKQKPVSPSAESVPALWNPTAARLWSLPFTWGFGAFLMAQNWKALGEHDKAKKSMIWFYSIFGFIFLGLITPDDDTTMKIFRFAGLGILAAWSIFSAQPQINFIKEHFGKEYPRRSWGKPIGITIGSFVLLMCLILVTSFISGFAASGKNIDIVRNGYLKINQTISVGQAFDSFLSNPKWEEIEAEDGNQYVNVTGEMTVNEESVNAKLQFRVFPETKTFKYQALTFDGIEQNDAMATNLIVTAFNEAGGNRVERPSNPLPANVVEEPIEQLPDEMVDDGETTGTWNGPNVRNPSPITQNQLDSMDISDLKKRIGNPDKTYRHPVKKNVFVSVWEQPNGKYLVMAGIEAIDGSNRDLYGLKKINRSQAVVENLVKEMTGFEFEDDNKIQEGAALQGNLNGRDMSKMKNWPSESELNRLQFKEIIAWLGEPDNVYTHIDPSRNIVAFVWMQPNGRYTLMTGVNTETAIYAQLRRVNLSKALAKKIVKDQTRRIIID